MVQPYGALIVGGIAGVISTLGFRMVSVRVLKIFEITSLLHKAYFLIPFSNCNYGTFQPLMEKKLKIHDTCGVHNLHGMPAILGVILSCIMAALANTEIYGKG